MARRATGVGRPVGAREGLTTRETLKRATGVRSLYAGRADVPRGVTPFVIHEGTDERGVALHLYEIAPAPLAFIPPPATVESCLRCSKLRAGNGKPLQRTTDR